MSSRLNWAISIITGWVLWGSFPSAELGPLAFLSTVLHFGVVVLTCGWFYTLLFRYVVPNEEWQMKGWHWAVLWLATIFFIVGGALGYRGGVAILQQGSTIGAFWLWALMSFLRLAIHALPPLED